MSVSRWTLLGLGLLGGACAGGRERPDPAELVSADPRPPKTDAGVGIDVPEPACGEFCGETFLREVKDPPNLYFVIDRSGSMGESVSGSSRTKLQTARAMIGELLRAIGHRVRFGGAVYPSHDSPEECIPGIEFHAPTLGVLPACGEQENEPLSKFTRTLEGFLPKGGTPTALTLDALRPRLEELEGRTAVVLVTDGAPNCDVEAECDYDECTLNIEKLAFNNLSCNSTTNCCDPEVAGEGANAYCVDDSGTEDAVLALAASGIATYVIGMPGAEPYADLLGRLALAGGQPREGDLPYYATTDEDELREALYAIGTGLAIRCEIDLETAPEDPELVNVYFDGELVLQDDEHGWSWDGETRIRVNGDACTDLRSGAILDARAVFGCETVVR
jgi:hypothetical protein